MRPMRKRFSPMLRRSCRRSASKNFWSTSPRCRWSTQLGTRRTQNWLEKAREALRSEHFTESVAHSAAALAIYLHHRDTRRGEPVDPSGYIHSFSGELGGAIDWILEYVEPIRARLDLVSHGIDVVSYDKFEALTPQTSVHENGTVSQFELQSRRVPLSRRSAFLL